MFLNFRQLDIGLERFEIKDLFVRLVTPTFFVIITVIQLHYFHKDFMALSDTRNVDYIDDGDSDVPTTNQQITDPSSERTDASDVKIDLTDLASKLKLLLSLYTFYAEFYIFFPDVSRTQLLEKFKNFAKKAQRQFNLIYLFLELHLPKLVLFMAMLVCVYDRCALYFVLVILIALSFTFGRPVQIFAIYCSSVLVSLLLLARMIYQIEYIEHMDYNVTCVSIWKEFVYFSRLIKHYKIRVNRY